MIIRSVEVRNFRSIREACLNCDDLTVIVGRNGAGKSSFLDAVDAFYDVAAQITEEDFFERDINSPIDIRVTYGNLRDDEKEEFKSYVADGKLIVAKRITSENGRVVQRYFAADLQIQQFAEIREMAGKKDRVSAWSELVGRGQLADLGGKARSADDVERLMSEYERGHPELTAPIEREVQFFGPRNIGGGKLDKFTKYVLVPAVREASDEVTGKKGAIYQILDMIVLREINAREDIQNFRLELQEKVKALYSSENLTELPELGNSISETLERFAPGCKLNLSWEEVKPPDISLPTARATLVEDDFEGEISRKGHGLQRALILTLLQHLATIVLSVKNVEEGVVEEAVPDESSASHSVQGPDLILAIEEPELYLHPSRCRYLSDLLFQLAGQAQGGLSARNQILYTTHSPYFVDLHRFDQIRLVRKVPSPDSPVPQSVVKYFSLEEAASDLANACNADPANFTRASFKARAMSVMNTIVNEGFFADVVVVVEGASEVSILWKLQEIMQKNWSRLGIVIVPAGGKNNIDRSVVIFRGLSIPTYFIFDADSQSIGKQGEEEARSRNHRYLRLASVPTEDFPDTTVQDAWAVFKNDLEGICKKALGDEKSLEIQKEVASELGYDDRERACKSIEGAALFVELVYQKGYRIPILEEIIEKATQLRTAA